MLPQPPVLYLGALRASVGNNSLAGTGRGLRKVAPERYSVPLVNVMASFMMFTVGQGLKSQFMWFVVINFVLSHEQKNCTPTVPCSQVAQRVRLTKPPKTNCRRRGRVAKPPRRNVPVQPSRKDAVLGHATVASQWPGASLAGPHETNHSDKNILHMTWHSKEHEIAHPQAA